MTTYDIGYQAYSQRHPLDSTKPNVFDPSQPQEWQNGWIQAQHDEVDLLTTG
jgi:hypothetical protein